MELGPRDRLSQAFVHEVEKGRTTDSPYGPVVHLDLRHLGEKLIDTKLPFVRELCLKYERIDPVHELIPVRPVVHYMMGGVHTDIDGATPLARAVRRGRDRLREHQRRQPARLQLAARVPGVRRPGRAGGRGVRLRRGRGRRPSSRRRRPTRCAAWSATCWARDRAPRASPPSATRCRPRWRTAPASSGRDPRWPRARTPSPSCRSASGTSALADTSRSFNTELLAALELANMLDIAECIVQAGMQRRGVAGRAPAHRLPGPRRRTFLTHCWCTATPTGRARVEHLPVTITRWPPGERVYGR